MSESPVERTWTKQINEEGEFVRRPASFRNAISADGVSGYPAARDRYHLYVSLACPWAHRVLIVRKLKGLEEVISVDVVHSFLGERGWSFRTDEPGSTGDRVNGFEYLSEAYARSEPDYQGSITVPALWDKQQGRIINNESSELIRMLNSEFQEYSVVPELDLYPKTLQSRIDEVNEWIYSDINNGVYRCGFARSQAAYDRAAKALFAALDKVELILSQSRYLVGAALTEADIRLFTTLVRFDAVYNTHFKCNLRRLTDYENISGFTRDIYNLPGVAETVDLDQIRDHYYKSHESLNPYRIVPIGPEVDFTAPHDRDTRFELR